MLIQVMFALLAPFGRGLITRNCRAADRDESVVSGLRLSAGRAMPGTGDRAVDADDLGRRFTMRRVLIVLLAISALASGGWALRQRRNSSGLGEHDAVQWPFDPAELRSLMSNVVSEQRARTASIEDKAGRDRAQAFLDYYERRRQMAAS